MSMFQVKFKVKGKLLALVLALFVIYLALVLTTNSLILAIVLGIAYAFFLRIAKTYAVSKTEVDRVMPKKVYLDARFDNLYEPVHFPVTDAGDGQTYNPELLDQTCDCQEYKDFHGFYPIGDFRRICRHQVKAYVDSGRLHNLYEPAQYMVGEAYKKNEGASFREILVSGLGENPSLFYFDEEDNVVGLIYKEGRDGKYEEYRLHLNDKSWENDFTPPYTAYMEQTLEGWRIMEARAAEKAARKLEGSVPKITG